MATSTEYVRQVTHAPLSSDKRISPTAVRCERTIMARTEKAVSKKKPLNFVGGETPQFKGDKTRQSRVPAEPAPPNKTSVTHEPVNRCPAVQLAGRAEQDQGRQYQLYKADDEEGVEVEMKQGQAPVFGSAPRAHVQGVRAVTVDRHPAAAGSPGPLPTPWPPPLEPKRARHRRARPLPRRTVGRLDGGDVRRSGAGTHGRALARHAGSTARRPPSTCTRRPGWQ